MAMTERELLRGNDGPGTMRSFQIFSSRMYRPPCSRSTTYMMPFFVYVYVVDAVGIGSGGYLGHEVGYLLRLEGVGGVEHPDSAVKESSVNQGVRPQGQWSGPVLVDVVGAIASGTVEEIIGVLHGEGADDHRVALQPVVHDPTSLG